MLLWRWTRSLAALLFRERLHTNYEQNTNVEKEGKQLFGRTYPHVSYCLNIFKLFLVVNLATGLCTITSTFLRNPGRHSLRPPGSTQFFFNYLKLLDNLMHGWSFGWMKRSAC